MSRIFLIIIISDELNFKNGVRLVNIYSRNKFSVLFIIFPHWYFSLLFVCLVGACDKRPSPEYTGIVFDVLTFHINIGFLFSSHDNKYLPYL